MIRLVPDDPSSRLRGSDIGVRAAVDIWYEPTPGTHARRCDGYRQLRFGLHLTSFKTGDAEWSAAAGWSDDSDRRTSVYFRFGVLTRR